MCTVCTYYNLANFQFNINSSIFALIHDHFLKINLQIGFLVRKLCPFKFLIYIVKFFYWQNAHFSVPILILPVDRKAMFSLSKGQSSQFSILFPSPGILPPHPPKGGTALTYLYFSHFCEKPAFCIGLGLWP